MYWNSKVDSSALLYTEDNWVWGQKMCMRSLEKEETTGVLRNRHQTGRPRKMAAVDGRNIVRAVKKSHKTSVCDLTNDLRGGQRRRYLKQPKEQQYRGYTTTRLFNHSSVVRIRRWLRSTKMSHKSFGTRFYGLMRPRLTSTKVMERPKCGEGRDLLMIQNIQTHLWSRRELSRLGLAWLLLECAH